MTPSLTVKELIRELNKFPDDAFVTIYADHGQCSFKVSDVSEVSISKDEWKNYMMDDTHPDDLDKDDEYVVVCQIE